MTNEALVDLALDRYHDAMQSRGGIAPTGVSRRTLARLVRVTPDEMSFALQDYRLIQGRRHTRYVVASRGYGRASRWYITRRPGSDPAVVQAARREQAVHMVSDAVRRAYKDAVHEVYPSLRSTAADEEIKRLIPLIEHQFQGLLEHIERTVTAAP